MCRLQWIASHCHAHTHTHRRIRNVCLDLNSSHQAAVTATTTTTATAVLLEEWNSKFWFDTATPNSNNNKKKKWHEMLETLSVETVKCSSLSFLLFHFNSRWSIQLYLCVCTFFSSSYPSLFAECLLWMVLVVEWLVFGAVRFSLLHAFYDYWIFSESMESFRANRFCTFRYLPWNGEPQHFLLIGFQWVNARERERENGKSSSSTSCAQLVIYGIDLVHRLLLAC